MHRSGLKEHRMKFAKSLKWNIKIYLKKTSKKHYFKNCGGKFEGRSTAGNTMLNIT